MTDKERRKLYGLSGKPLNATRVLQRSMNSGDFNGQEAFCLLVIDDVAGTITPMNTYNGNAGSNFNPQPRPLPGTGSDRWKTYEGRGYKPGKVEDHKALKAIKAPAPAAPAAS